LMKVAELAFQEFVDALHTASTELAFKSVAERTAQRFGFRWFAYLSFAVEEPLLISSYPGGWTRHYFAERYYEVDPVVEHARRQHTLFRWNGEVSDGSGSRAQRRLFDEATSFGIKTGVTIPIKGGFGRFGAFTLAADEENQALENIIATRSDMLQLVALYYHAQVEAKLESPSPGVPIDSLSQRERECLAWAARGKTMEETAGILRVKPRTVLFHVENARRKLDASTCAHAVALAIRKGLLP
jgi:LuxR family transcriptional regulator, activator of conjugal transfer of Ti plasmids